MSKHKSISKKAGLPPGALIHIGNKKSKKTVASVIDFSTDHIDFVMCNSLRDCFEFRDKNTISWINISGLENVDAIAELGAHFDLHPLLLEDVLNTHHRPKFEEFENCLFISLKMLGIAEDAETVVTEQVSLVMGEGWVISFQELDGDIFDPIRKRLKNAGAPLRNRTTDYLLYRLIDTIVDNYFLVTENIADRTDKLETEVLEEEETNTLKQIQLLKRQIMQVRRSVGPLREAIIMLQKEDVKLISKTTNRYLHDVYEHLVQLTDTIDSQREIVGSIMDLYLNNVNNRMNKVMQLLTIISTIFIPITFIAGIYGMNFVNMPELQATNGYYVVLGVMFALIVTMLLYFKRKKWL